VPQKSHSYVHITPQERNFFLKLRREFFSTLVIHSSYWINPATGDSENLKIAQTLIKKELAFVEQLEANFLIFHAGSAVGYPSALSPKAQHHSGILTLARVLNTITQNTLPFTILLENTAHAHSSIGSNLDDFTELKKHLTHPERIGFCIDFAHAYAYGYNLLQTDDFIQKLDTSLGLNSIKLIHFNDSESNLKSHKDIHALPGEGKIGKNAMQKLLFHPQLQSIPLIIELPAISRLAVIQFLEQFKNWKPQ
jgi:deoxyribonuclease-4